MSDHTSKPGTGGQPPRQTDTKNGADVAIDPSTGKPFPLPAVGKLIPKPELTAAESAWRIHIYELGDFRGISDGYSVMKFPVFEAQKRWLSMAWPESVNILPLRISVEHFWGWRRLMMLKLRGLVQALNERRLLTPPDPIPTGKDIQRATELQLATLGWMPNNLPVRFQDIAPGREPTHADVLHWFGLSEGLHWFGLSEGWRQIQVDADQGKARQRERDKRDYTKANGRPLAVSGAESRAHQGEERPREPLQSRTDAAHPVTIEGQKEPLRVIVVGQEPAAVTPEKRTAIDIADKPHALVNGQTATADGDGDAALSPLEADILEVLYNLVAYSIDKRRSSSCIAQKIEKTKDNIARPLANLKRRKLIEALARRDGGYWLTEKGIERLKQLKGSSKPPAP